MNITASHHKNFSRTHSTSPLPTIQAEQRPLFQDSFAPSTVRPSGALDLSKMREESVDLSGWRGKVNSGLLGRLQRELRENERISACVEGSLSDSQIETFKEEHGTLIHAIGPIYSAREMTASGLEALAQLDSVKEIEGSVYSTERPSGNVVGIDTFVDSHAISWQPQELPYDVFENSPRT